MFVLYSSIKLLIWDGLLFINYSVSKTFVAVKLFILVRSNFQKISAKLASKNICIIWHSWHVSILQTTYFLPVSVKLNKEITICNYSIIQNPYFYRFHFVHVSSYIEYWLFWRAERSIWWLCSWCCFCWKSFWKVSIFKSFLLVQFSEGV